MKAWMAALLVCSLVLSGCASSLAGSGGATTVGPANNVPAHSLKAWLRQQSRAKKGVVVGAIVGAIAGYGRARILGHDPLKGAVAGLLIGRRQDTLHGSRDEAVARLGYDPSQGYILAVDEVRFEPPRVAPGGTATVYVRYLVVGPRQDEDLRVQAFTGVKYDGKYMNAIGPDTYVVPRGGGIVETRSAVTIPAKAAKGTYSIEALFEDSYGRFQSSRESVLYVG